MMATRGKKGKERAATERNFDRTFILFGKGCSGKSTLGNLILGGKPFKTHEFHEPGGLTVEIKSSDCQVEAKDVYDLNGRVNEWLNIQVIDQPGTSDYNFDQVNHCEFLKQSIAVSKAEMSASFLILFDLSSNHFTPKELLTIINLAEFLSDSCYSFFSNAVMVFTHADEIDEAMNQDKLETELRLRIKDEDFFTIKELIGLVENRYIFINGTITKPENRFAILKKLFRQTRPNLNVYINGNNGFKRKELKKLMGEDAENNTFQKSSLKYEVEYHLNPDLNLFRRFKKQDLEENISSALEKLSGIAKGISAMVLLISFCEVFNEEIYDLVLNLPNTYNLGKNFKKDFWDYACIFFKAPIDDEEFIKKNIANNKLLSKLDLKVKSRYAWVTKKTDPNECSKRLIDLVRRVKLDAEGKSYTDSVVLAEMKQFISESSKLKKSRRKTKMVDGISEELHSDVPIYQKSNSEVCIESNKLFRDKDTISPLLGYWILMSIDPDIAGKFGEEKKAKGDISSTDFADFCTKSMKKM